MRIASFSRGVGWTFHAGLSSGPPHEEGGVQLGLQTVPVVGVTAVAEEEHRIPARFVVVAERVGCLGYPHRGSHSGPDTGAHGSIRRRIASAQSARDETSGHSRTNGPSPRSSMFNARCNFSNIRSATYRSAGCPVCSANWVKLLSRSPSDPYVLDFSTWRGRSSCQASYQ